MGSQLSWHELRVLERIEEDLRADRELDLALTTMRIPGDGTSPEPFLFRALQRIPTWLLVACFSWAVGMTAVVVEDHSGVAFTLFGLAWGLAVLLSTGRGTARRTFERRIARRKGRSKEGRPLG